MIMRFIFSVSVFTVLFTGNVLSWTYQNLNDWPSLCKTGERQSPIALSKNAARRAFIPPLFFKNYRNTFRASLENNGHTVEIKLIPDDVEDVPRLLGGGIGEYILQNIHFHWDSEHTIDGQRYPLEGHYVHFKKQYGNLTNAVNYRDGVIVLGVMFKVTLRQNENFVNLLDSVKRVSKRVNVEDEINNGFEVADILPKNTQTFYTYDGSLTTPNCNEAVKWIVFQEVLSIGKKQLKQLRNIETDTGELLTTNYRPIQKLNNREVYYSHSHWLTE